MAWFLYILIGILLLAIIVCAFVKWKLKRRLDSIDGFVGTIRNDGDNGKIVGGQFADNTAKTTPRNH
jgi:hypothetical protein